MKTIEHDVDLWVYLALAGLTGLTVASSFFPWARLVAVTLALAIASAKAVLIGFYYMHLREEGPLVYGIVLTGLTMVAILTFGILPDMAVAPQ